MVSKTKKSTTKKKITRKKTSTSPKVSKQTVHLERAVIENFVALQKVMTNLSLRFDNLSTQISNLLELFEISAKNLAQKDFGAEKENRNSKEIISKLNNLTDQNKVIARGLTLLHESEDSYGKNPEKKEMKNEHDYEVKNAKHPNLVNKQASMDMGDYEKSLSPDKSDDIQKS
ncbi:MAG: hypothetical protein WDZ77_02055 [Candidatus Pacearchaeota archaeon]